MKNGRNSIPNDATAARRVALLAWFRDQPARAFRLVELPPATGPDARNRRSSDLTALCASGDLAATTVDGVFYVATQRALLPERRATVPGLADGPGERRDDCIHVAACLDVLTRAKPLALAGHCRPGCLQYVPIPRESRIGLATLSQSALAAAERIPNGFGLEEVGDE